MGRAPAWVVLAIIAAACGGAKPTPAIAPAEASAAEDPRPDPEAVAFAAEYGSSYRGCAEERARYASSSEDDAEVDPDELAAEVSSALEDCRGLVEGLGDPEDEP